MSKILIIDDEQGIRSVLSDIFMDENFEVITAENGKKGLELFENEAVDLVVLDVWLPDISGIDLLKEISQKKKDLPIIIISGHANIDIAVKALEMGAYDFLEKPLSIDKMMSVINNALEVSQLKNENKSLKAALGQLSDPIPSGKSLNEAILAFEKEYIANIIREEGSVLLAAKKLQITVAELQEKLDGFASMNGKS